MSLVAHLSCDGHVKFASYLPCAGWADAACDYSYMPFGHGPRRCLGQGSMLLTEPWHVNGNLAQVISSMRGTFLEGSKCVISASSDGKTSLGRVLTQRRRL
eukprot:4686562-Amphidinium_carterae.1